MSIQRTILTGIRWTGLSSLFGVLIGFLQVAILARYLEKSDFAWVAIAGVFVNIGIHLQQAGINTALVQRSNLTKIQLSTAYWFNIIGGFLLFTTAVPLAFLLKWAYSSPILVPITVCYSFIFIIQAISVQYKALLQKNFYFQVLAIGESLGIGAGFVFSIITAVNDWGAFALVGGYGVRYLAEAVWMLLVGRPYFMPGLVWNWQSIQPLLHFGGWHWAERLITHFTAQIDVLLIGKLLGSEALGTYEVFKRVLVRPLNLLNEVFEKVTFPVFASLQNDVSQQKKIYLNLLSHLTAINLPVLIFLAIAAAPVVGLLFGTKWLEGVPIFQLLCGFCTLHFLLNPVDTLLLANNKIKLWLYANAAFVSLQAGLLTLGSAGGLATMTLANVTAHAIFTLVIYIWIVLPQLQSNFVELLKTLVRPFVLTLLAATILLPMLFFELNLLLLFIMVAFSIIVYIILNYFYNKDFVIILWQFTRFKNQ